MANEGAQFRSELIQQYDFQERKLNHVFEKIQRGSKTRNKVDSKPDFFLEDPSQGLIEDLNFADTDFFPNIRKLLILAAPYPI